MNWITYVGSVVVATVLLLIASYLANLISPGNVLAVLLVVAILGLVFAVSAVAMMFSYPIAVGWAILHLVVIAALLLVFPIGTSSILLYAIYYIAALMLGIRIGGA